MISLQTQTLWAEYISWRRRRSCCVIFICWTFSLLDGSCFFSIFCDNIFPSGFLGSLNSVVAVTCVTVGCGVRFHSTRVSHTSRESRPLSWHVYFDIYDRITFPRLFRDLSSKTGKISSLPELNIATVVASRTILETKRFKRFLASEEIFLIRTTTRKSTGEKKGEKKERDSCRDLSSQFGEREEVVSPGVDLRMPFVWSFLFLFVEYIYFEDRFENPRDFLLHPLKMFTLRIWNSAVCVCVCVGCVRLFV